MSTGLIIYFASISTGICTSSFILAFISFMTGVILLLINSDNKNMSRPPIKNVWLKFSGLIIMFVFFTIVVALVPSSENIYKITGVNEQQKAMIDATGSVVKNSTQR